MEKMTQKQAVFAAMLSVFGVSEFEGKVEPSKDQRASVNNILFEGFRSGRIAYEGELPEDSDLKAYVSGLQSNWLRKDKRLNGNIAYVPANPGSRTGSTDPQVRAMKALLATKTDATERAEIQAFIDRRVGEIKPSKTVTINVADLPEALRHLAK